jgi:hypothetical protein
MFSQKILMLLLCVLFLTAACKKEIAPKPDPKGILTAKAGDDQTAEPGQQVSLDGSASTDSQNKPFSFQWIFTKKPTGSTVTLTGANTAKPAFIPDLPGEFELELTIANANGQSTDKVLIRVASVQALLLPEQITEATVLEDRITDPSLPDYIADKTVVVTAQLTIKPGVTIAFARDTRFDINSNGGVLIARGEADKKIRLTGKELTRGYWRGVVIYSNSGANELDHVEISYAGSHPTLSTFKAGLTLFGGSKAQASIRNSLFLHNDGYGIHAADGSVLKAFAANTFSHQAEAGIVLAADNVPQLDAASVFTGSNGRNTVEILPSAITDAGRGEVVWTGFADKTPYRVLGEMRVSAGWKLLPGVTVEVARDQLLMIESKGYLNAAGTAAEKIVITGVERSPGYWRGIACYSASAQNVLRHTEVSYGGSNPLISGKKANIALVGSQATLSVTDSRISGSAGYGIYGRYNTHINADVRTANTFDSNALNAVFLEDAHAEMPANIPGQWMYGNFSMTEFWTQDGSYSGNAVEVAVAFDFKANGQAELYIISGGTSYACRTEAFEYKKGTVQFNQDNSFTFYPTEGRVRGFYKGCAPSYQNYDKALEPGQLQPQTFYFSFEKDGNGKEQLLIRFEKNSPNVSYFRRVQW